MASPFVAETATPVAAEPDVQALSGQSAEGQTDASAPAADNTTVDPQPNEATPVVPSDGGLSFLSIFHKKNWHK